MIRTLPHDGDLHLHSTASDGTRTPTDLIEKASRHRLPYLALTDHDTIAGIAEARQAIDQLTARGLYKPHFIPGVELSVHFEEQEIHLLAYFPNGQLDVIGDFLASQRHARVRRNMEILAKLEQIGFYINRKDIPSSYNTAHSWGRMHIAKALVKKGYFENNRQAFHALLLPGRPAFVERQKITVTDAMEVIRACHGIAIVAHPQLYGWCRDQTANVVSPLLLKKCQALKQIGIDGIEAGHGDASPHELKQMLATALTLNLLYTSGSDDHGSSTPHRQMYTASTTRFPHDPALVVCALIQNKERRYLLGRRAPTEQLAGFYELPGGKVNRAEDNKSALKREIQEELELTSTIGGLRAVLWNDSRARFLALAVYETKIDNKTPQMTVHDDFTWMTADEALHSHLLPADFAFFQTLADRDKKQDDRQVLP